jgi:5'-nucleotidase
VAAPAVERSWIGKAISRFDEVPVKKIERDGVPMMSVSGYPADAVQLGMYNLFDDEVEMVVSGVNIGANFGAAYYAGSGTVGAALEAGIAGVPAFAFSVVNVGHFKEWALHMRTPESIPDWERYAAVSAVIVDEVMAAGYPEGINIVTVNMPAEVTVDTRRRVTHIADTSYGQLFQEQSPGIYRHDWTSDMHVTDRMWGSDIQAVADGQISITAVRIAAAGVESQALRDIWD